MYSIEYKCTREPKRLRSRKKPRRRFQTLDDKNLSVLSELQPSLTPSHGNRFALHRTRHEPSTVSAKSKCASRKRIKGFQPDFICHTCSYAYNNKVGDMNSGSSTSGSSKRDLE